ncbi:POK6 protein, partial [Orthonyx spaldingii]|nr:POK6 protein [Orthonyx spaldingii]
MGTLQPGLPSPLMIAEGWDLLIIDLKYCFFTIPLHPEDTARFSFSSHALLHQSAKSLVRQFLIPHADATGIVRSCPDC